MSEVFSDPGDGRGPYQLLTCRGQKYVLQVKISPEDYAWAVEQGNWFITHGARMEDRYKPMTSGYAVRSVGKQLVWLHKMALVRAGVIPPSSAHTIGDHINGDRLDDRRGNMRWATCRMNARNIFGFADRQLELF